MADQNSIMIIEQVSHDPEWDNEYRREAQKLCEILGDEIVAVHHIGSTSIPDITAKPVIDILGEARRIEDIDIHNEAMARQGYQARGEFGLPGRRFFVKGVPKRTHHVHIFQAGSPEIYRHLAFRDYMIAHPDDARKYSELKQKLAIQYKGDIDGYCDGKDAFVKEMERKAIAWAKIRQK
ncbi:MAG TPA: GrpB family protein [Methanocellaceae archaeon]